MNEKRYLIELLKAELNGETAGEVPKECDPKQLFALAEYHSVSGIALYALEKTKTALDGELYDEWRQSRDKAIVRDITQQMEAERIGDSFAAAGIRFIALKGCRLKQLYPQSDMRTMSDIDLFIDGENAEKVWSIMLALGYTCEEYGHGIHDIYYMPPVMNVEIHRSLFGERGAEFGGIFANPWEMCKKSEGAGYELTEEAFFAHLLAHAITHFEDGGTGIRTIADIRVYTHSPQAARTDDVLALLGAAGKAETAQRLLELSDVWFGDAPKTEQSSETERYIFESGTHGTMKNSAINSTKKSIEKNGKAGYIFVKLFPPYKFMCGQYPILKKAPLLLPVMWLVRIVKKLFGERDENAEKLKMLMKK